MEFKSVNNNFFVFHAKEASIAFFNLDKSQVKRLVFGLEKQNIVLNSFTTIFIAEASAEEFNCSSPIKNPYQYFENISDKVENSILFKKIGECAVTALKGAKGQVEDTAKFFKKLVIDPTALWEDVSQSYAALKTFTMNFSREIQDLYKTMGELTIDEKLNIACTLTGQIGSASIMSLTGAGLAVGGAKLVSSIVPKLMRLKNMMTQFQRFKIPKKTAMETLSCGI
jgi:hypothetical protein